MLQTVNGKKVETLGFRLSGFHRISPEACAVMLDGRKRSYQILVTRERAAIKTASVRLEANVIDGCGKRKTAKLETVAIAICEAFNV